MSVDLRNRDFLKELDFTTAELQYLLDLSARPQAGQVRRAPRCSGWRGRNVALIFEKTSTRTRCAFEVGCYDQGAHVTYLDPTLEPDRPQGVRRRHGAGAVADVRRHRVPRQGAGHRRGARRQLRRPGLQRAHRRVAPHADARRLPHDDRAQPRARRSRRSPTATSATRGPTWATRCSSWARSWAPTCASPHPKDLWPAKDIIDAAQERAAGSGARDHADRGPGRRACRGADFVHTDVWVSMGEPKEVWDERVDAADAVPGQRRGAGADRASPTRSSCTACRPSTTRTRCVGRTSPRRPA